MTDYEFICDRISSLKRSRDSLKNESDDYVFSVLAMQSAFYKNPAYHLDDEDIKNMIVDGQGDGGVDILLSDPSSEESDMLICQSKFYQSITFDDVRNAITKMIEFFKDMQNGDYQNVNAKVQKRYLDLYSEVGDESKIKFVFFTSAPKNSINITRISKIIRDSFSNHDKFCVDIYFGKDVVDEIVEAESRRPTVESGKLIIDKPGNYLKYCDDAVIANISAFSLKELYAKQSVNLLSKNLRYYIRNRDIDKEIEDTIRNSSDTFWFKNNGVTIICDDFSVDGRELKLTNFSIVNGGQTTYLIYKSSNINKSNDLFLTCRVIKNLGDTEDEKNSFSLQIAKATNSQKAIKNIDLKANAPEQVRFSIEMRNAGIYYQTKRGESIPKEYRLEYLNADLASIGKLCLAGVMQRPGKSRSQPSLLYKDQFYNVIFNYKQGQISGISRDLLYMDYYFRKIFIQKYDKQNKNSASMPFAHNARTICIAFVTLMSRYYQGNFDISQIKNMLSSLNNKDYEDCLYDIFKDIKEIKRLFNISVYNNKNSLDDALYNLYEKIITIGYSAYNFTKEDNETLNETNFLKDDKNYYKILKSYWDELIKFSEDFKAVF